MLTRSLHTPDALHLARNVARADIELRLDQFSLPTLTPWLGPFEPRIVEIKQRPGLTFDIIHALVVHVVNSLVGPAISDWTGRTLVVAHARRILRVVFKRISAQAATRHNEQQHQHQQ